MTFTVKDVNNLSVVRPVVSGMTRDRSRLSSIVVAVTLFEAGQGKALRKPCVL